MVNRYVIGNTIKFTATTKDYSGNLVDVDSIYIKITDKNGNTILDETAMTKTATGTYEYEWDTSNCSEGYYYYFIYGTHGTAKFKVRAEIQLYT